VLGCYHAVPLTPRKRPTLVAERGDGREETGVFFLQDVYAGPGLAGISRGTVKSLRVVALEYRAASIAKLDTKGPGGVSWQSTPVAIGNGTYDVKRVLGQAKVYEDGSACFVVPASTPVYFQALDGEGHVVQSMRSWATLQPGEYFGCVGCHESKHQTPVVRGVAMALRADPQRLDPFYGPPRGFSFSREIQPILDRHCVHCHAPSEPGPEGPDPRRSQLSLRPDRQPGPGKRFWSESYLALTRADPNTGIGQPNPLVYWLNVQSVPTLLPPYTAGAAKSRLIAMLRAGHEEVELSKEELDKIACWIDLLVPFCGDYAEANAWTDADRQLYATNLEKRRRSTTTERAGTLAGHGKQP